MWKKTRLYILLTLFPLMIFFCLVTVLIPEDAESRRKRQYHIPPVTPELEKLRKELSPKIPLDTKLIFETGMQKVKYSGAVDNALQVGDKAPDFTLLDIHGKEIQLSTLLKKRPVILVWYRGGWCPYCNLYLRELNKAMYAFGKVKAHVVAISPELPDKSLVTQKKNKLKFMIVSDVGNKTAKAYGVAYRLPKIMHDAMKEWINFSDYNGDDSGFLPLTATYVIGRDGIISYAFLDIDYKKRAEPAVLLKEVRKLTNR